MELTRAIRTAAEHNILTPPFVLITEDCKKVTVGEVLADPEKYNEMRCADPLEPSYGGDDTRIAYVELSSGKPFIYSHAHGGMLYRLVRTLETIIVERGERPRNVDECLAVMQETRELYEFGRELTLLLDDGAQMPVSPDLLGDYLGRRIRFMTWSKKELVPIDTPDKICTTIIAKGRTRGLLPLNGVITAPTLRSDGSLLHEPGYDEASGLYLHGDHFPSIPENLDDDGLRAAHTLLWQPFKDFPYVNSTSRGVMLSAVLCSTVRRTLPTAPAVCADAAMAGTGKTLLMKCLMRLTGEIPEVQPSTDDDEKEFKKRLLATLRSGKRAFLLDNLRGEFEVGFV